MLRLLPAPLRGVITTLILALNTLVCGTPLLLLVPFKALPIPALQSQVRALMHWIAESWISINSGWMRLAGHTDWNVAGLEQFDKQHSYLITSNHQSWVDILVLQHLLNNRAPFLKFFLKQELIWVPVIGVLWWALEFPFMKRYSKAYLAKYPEKKGTDLLTTRKACARFKSNSVSVFNFLEGTRHTAAKHAQQNSPFQYLLKPKAGGIAFVLDAMGDQLSALINVTIHYPCGRPTFWDLLCGRVPQVVVRLQKQAIPSQFIGKSYEQDDAYRLEFQQWVNRLWEQKDAELAELHNQFPVRQKHS